MTAGGSGDDRSGGRGSGEGGAGSGSVGSEGAGSGGGPGDGSAEGRRPARIVSQRVTLQFAGPKLALPGESPPEPLRLDTSEFEIPPEAPRNGPAPGGAPAPVGADRPSLELDLDGLEPPPAPELPDGSGLDGVDASETDGWGRLRDGQAARARSVTPSTRGDDALTLVSQRSRPPSTPGLDLASEMADRYALGDFTGALRVAELVLGKTPDDVRAQKCAESSRERLIQLYSARLATLGPATVGGAEATPGGPEGLGARVPRVRVPEHEIKWLGLDHRQGFLLSRLDGTSSIEDLVDLSGMTRLEVLRTLVELVEAGAITLT